MFRSETGDVLWPAIGFLGIKRFFLGCNSYAKTKMGPFPAAALGMMILSPPSSPQVT